MRHLDALKDLVKDEEKCKKPSFRVHVKDYQVEKVPGFEYRSSDPKESKRSRQENKRVRINVLFLTSPVLNKGYIQKSCKNLFCPSFMNNLSWSIVQLFMALFRLLLKSHHTHYIAEEPQVFRDCGDS